MSLNYGYFLKGGLIDCSSHVKAGDILVTPHFPSNHGLYSQEHQWSQGICCSFQIKSNQIHSHYIKVFFFPRLIIAFFKIIAFLKGHLSYPRDITYYKEING